eukprot:m.29394 g.29394  ORF g.29394 m.29394 type:complete len:673 (+) comp9133_c0_seq2:195-2213(+)
MPAPRSPRYCRHSCHGTISSLGGHGDQHHPAGPPPACGPSALLPRSRRLSSSHESLSSSAAPSRTSSPTPSQVSVTSASSRRFEVVRELGEGSFGVVWLAFDTQSHDHVAIKELANARSSRRWRREYSAARHLRHPNIVRTRGVFRTGEDSLLLVQEPCLGGELHARLSESCGVPPHEGRRYVSELLDALDYIHESHHLVHCDIKPENMLLSHGHIKLCDFGSAQKIGPRGRVGGTMEYMAPEMVRSAETRQQHCEISVALDLWSVGVLTLALLRGPLPWLKASEHDEAYRSYREEQAAGQYTSNMRYPWTSLSKRSLAAVGHMLHIDPSARSSREQIRAYINSVFWTHAGRQPGSPASICMGGAGSGSGSGGDCLFTFGRSVSSCRTPSVASSNCSPAPSRDASLGRGETLHHADDTDYGSNSGRLHPHRASLSHKRRHHHDQQQQQQAPAGWMTDGHGNTFWCERMTSAPTVGGVASPSDIAPAATTGSPLLSRRSSAPVDHGVDLRRRASLSPGMQRRRQQGRQHHAGNRHHGHHGNRNGFASNHHHRELGSHTELSDLAEVFPDFTPSPLSASASSSPTVKTAEEAQAQAHAAAAAMQEGNTSMTSVETVVAGPTTPETTTPTATSALPSQPSSATPTPAPSSTSCKNQSLCHSPASAVHAAVRISMV